MRAGLLGLVIGAAAQLAAPLFLLLAAPALAAVNVVATTTDLAALVREVGAISSLRNRSSRPGRSGS